MKTEVFGSRGRRGIQRGLVAGEAGGLRDDPAMDPPALASGKVVKEDAPRKTVVHLFEFGKLRNPVRDRNVCLGEERTRRERPNGGSVVAESLKVKD